MPHVVLLGDSIFDNQAYVRAGEPDVIHQLRERLPDGWRATLLAVDGDVTNSVHSQLERLPADATHLVISVGGNDALGNLSALNEPVHTISGAFARFATLRASFEDAYRRMLEAVLARGLPTAVCTVYNGASPDPAFQRVATIGVALWDDVILGNAVERGLPVLELRRICADRADYANPIEPSARGGAKIAASIAALLAAHDFSVRRAQVYTLPASGA